MEKYHKLVERIRNGEFQTKLKYPSPTEFGVTDKRKLWKEDQNRLNKEFEEAAIEAVGLKGHPKAYDAFALAYDYGHSDGHHSVLNYLHELSELIL